MARLPIPGSDNGTWGNLLNEFLEVEHNADGTLKAGGSLAGKADDSAVVHKTGSEVIAGVKTFSASPAVPTPVNAADAVPKSYVDALPAPSVPVVRAARFTSGNITAPNTSGGWQILVDGSSNPIQVSIPAQSGEWVEISINGMTTTTASISLDVGVIVGSSIVRYLASGTSTPLLEGDPGLYPQPVSFNPTGYGSKGLVVAPGDLDGSNLRLAMVIKAAGQGTFFASSTYPFYMRALNLGVVA